MSIHDLGEAMREKKAQSVIEHLVDLMDHQADWRYRLSAQYPGDDRNAAAADRMTRLLRELSDCDAQKHSRLMGLAHLYFDDPVVSQYVIEYLGRIGFDHFPESAGELLSAVCDILERRQEDVA